MTATLTVVPLVMMDTRSVMHVGVKPENVASLTAFARRAGLSMAVDGDGWNCWGEAPGTDVNDLTTLHVVLEGANLAVWVWDMLLTAMILEGVPLAQMTSENDRGVLAAVSEWEDWAVEFGVHFAPEKTLARA